MLDEGAGKLDSLAIADRAERLGAQTRRGLLARHVVRGRVGADRPGSTRRSHCWPTSCAARRFPQQEIERVRKEWIAGIAREKMSPDALAMRVLPPLLYGAGHPYAIPFSGSGTEASVAALTRDDLARVPARLAAARQRDDHRDRRRDAGDDPAAAREALRRLGSRRRRSPRPRRYRRRRRRPPATARLPARPAGCAADRRSSPGS